MTLVNVCPEIESTPHEFGIELHFSLHNEHRYASALYGGCGMAAWRPANCTPLKTAVMCAHRLTSIQSARSGALSERHSAPITWNQ